MLPPTVALLPLLGRPIAPPAGVALVMTPLTVLVVPAPLVGVPEEGAVVELVELPSSFTVGMFSRFEEEL